MKQRRRPEDIGAMGESFFKLLAKDAGLVANTSDEDRAGWDFEVEHPSPLVVDYSSQSRPLYRVQVKTTTGPSPKVAVTYSGLLSLIQFSGPAFIFVVCYGNKTTPDDAYLLHINKDIAHTILRSLRNLEVRKPTFKINKAKMTIRCPADSRLDELSGRALKAIFEASVTDPYLEYVKSKIQWLQAIEKESTRWHFEVRLQDEDALAAMANCFLGYDESFNVTSVGYLAPLGIPGEIPPHPKEFAATTIKPIVDDLEKATVRLASSQFAPKYPFSAIIYSVPKQLPLEIGAMRIRTALFEIVFRVNDRQLTFRPEDLLSPDLTAPLSELHGFMSYMRDAREHQTTYLEVEPTNGSAPLSLNLGVLNVTVPSDFDEIFRAFDVTYAKLVKLGLMGEKIRPSLLIEHPAPFHMLDVVGKAYPNPIEFEFESENSASLSVDAVIFNSEIELGTVTVLFYAAFFGDVQQVAPGTLLGRFTHSELLDQFVISHRTDIGPIKESEEARLEKDLMNRGFCVLK